MSREALFLVINNKPHDLFHEKVLWSICVLVKQMSRTSNVSWSNVSKIKCLVKHFFHMNARLLFLPKQMSRTSNVSWNFFFSWMPGQLSSSTTSLTTSSTRRSSKNSYGLTNWLYDSHHFYTYTSCSFAPDSKGPTLERIKHMWGLFLIGLAGASFFWMCTCFTGSMRHLPRLFDLHAAVWTADLKQQTLTLFATRSWPPVFALTTHIANMPGGVNSKPARGHEYQAHQWMWHVYHRMCIYY